MQKEALLSLFAGKLIVSCQALPGEPLYRRHGGIMPLFAKAALEAGAVGIRANSIRDIKQIKKAVDAPIIGLIKRNYLSFETYITPTLREVDALVKIGCDVVAVEYTSHTRQDGQHPSEFVRSIKLKYPDVLIMADCATLQDAISAESAGVDFIGTTMSGYTDDSPPTEGPDYELVRQILENCHAPLFAEGRIHTPEQAQHMISLGAHCVIVGGAITRPREITQRFVSSLYLGNQHALTTDID